MVLTPSMKSCHIFFAIGALLTFAGPTWAWGDLGHQVTALIAYRHLTAPMTMALWP